jgi:SulP family sulfate permease
VVKAVSLGPGEALFRQGDVGDEVYLVRQGEVRILLPLPGGARHHLATFGRGDFLGEIAFLDRGTRTADAVAKTDCELYVMSREAFDRMATTSPDLAGHVFARLARALSERLRQADAELRALEDR